MANILLSGIGRSPGAVTGICHALSEEEPPVKIDHVVLISTTLPQVREAGEIVRQVLSEDGIQVHIFRLRGGEVPSHDFTDRWAVLDFIHQVNAVMEHARRAGDSVYIGISGGRSSMGALLTLSAYIYGAAGIYHLWVDEEIEWKGDVTRLPSLSSERLPILKPPADRRKLVAIPLAPFDQVWDRGRLGQILAERPQAREALLRAVTDVELQQLETLKQQREASFEEVAQRLREIFEGTEIEHWVELSIKVSGGEEEPVRWEVEAVPYLKPPLREQIRRELQDLETYKRAADRLLTFVENIAQPLVVAGLAAMLGLTLQ
ncbi:MAG TPA: hypothetical protein ENK08_11350 [Chloroflexi bacterium]|nr:hypothetical protein [Chloroflexota bacterium]